MVKLARTKPLKFILLVIGLMFVYSAAGTNLFSYMVKGRAVLGTVQYVHLDSPQTVKQNIPFVMKVALVDQLGLPVSGHSYGTKPGSFYIPPDAIKNSDGNSATFAVDATNVKEDKDGAGRDLGIYSIPITITDMPDSVTSPTFVATIVYNGGGVDSPDNASDPAYQLAASVSLNNDKKPQVGVVRYSAVSLDKTTLRVPEIKPGKPTPNPGTNFVTFRVSLIGQEIDYLIGTKMLRNRALPNVLSNWEQPRAFDNSGRPLNVSLESVTEEQVEVTNSASAKDKDKTIWGTGIYDVKIKVESPADLAGRNAVINFGYLDHGIRHALSGSINFTSTGPETEATQNPFIAHAYIIEKTHTAYTTYGSIDIIGVIDFDSDTLKEPDDKENVPTNGNYIVADGVLTHITHIRVQATILDSVGDLIVGARLMRQDTEPAPGDSGGTAMSSFAPWNNSPLQVVYYDIPAGTIAGATYAEKAHNFWVQGRSVVGWGSFKYLTDPVETDPAQSRKISVDKTPPTIAISDPAPSPTKIIGSDGYDVLGTTVDAGAPTAYKAPMMKVNVAYPPISTGYVGNAVERSGISINWSDWHFGLNLGTTNGTVTFSAKAFDYAGNESTPASVDVAADTIPPIASITTPAQGAGLKTSPSLIPIIGEVYDVNILPSFASYVVQWAPGIKALDDDTGWTNGTNRITYPSGHAGGTNPISGAGQTIATWNTGDMGGGDVALAPGPYSLRVISYDVAGNISEKNPVEDTTQTYNRIYMYIDNNAPSSGVYVPYDSGTQKWIGRTIWGTADDYNPVTYKGRKEETDAALSYSVPWQTDALPVTQASGGGVKYSSTAGQSVSYTFTGSFISWITTKGPNRGFAWVQIDGDTVAAGIDLNNSTYLYQQAMYMKTWPTSGTHTITVGVSSGRVDIDAFDLEPASGVDKVEVSIKQDGVGGQYWDNSLSTPGWNGTTQIWNINKLSDMSGRHDAHVSRWELDISGIPNNQKVNVQTRATDDAGNREAPAAAVDYYVDSKFPTNTITPGPTGENGWYNYPNPNLVVTGAEPNTPASQCNKIFYKWTDTSIMVAPATGWTIYDPGTKADSIAIDIGKAPPTDGSWKLWYYCIDRAENYSVSNTTVKTDNGSPTEGPTFSSPADGSNQRLTFSLSGAIQINPAVDLISGMQRIDVTVKNQDTGYYWQNDASAATITDSDAGYVTYTPSLWSSFADASATNGQFRRSNVVGQTAVFTFTGRRSAEWLPVKGPFMGTALVQYAEDGVTYDAGTLINLNCLTNVYTESPSNMGGPYKKMATGTGTHRIKITVDVAGTPGYVTVDGFKISDTWGPSPFWISCGYPNLYNPWNFTNWNSLVKTANLDGNYRFYARAVDMAGNPEHTLIDDNAYRSLLVDNTAPSTTHTLSPAAPDGNVDGGKTWYKSNVTISLNPFDPPVSSAIELSHWTLKLNTSTTIFDVNYAGSATTGDMFSGSYADGQYELRYWTRDKVQNQETEQVTTFWKDSNPPTSSFTSPANGLVKRRTVAMAGTASDSGAAGSGVSGEQFALQYNGTDASGNANRYWDGTAWSSVTAVWLPLDCVYGAGIWTANWDTLATKAFDGDYTVYARAVDKAGCVQSDAITSRLITIDNTNPYVSAADPYDGKIKVPISVNPLTYFSEKMVSTTINGTNPPARTYTMCEGSLVGPIVTGTATYTDIVSPPSSFVTFQPSVPTSPLNIGTTYYNILTTAATDLAGNALNNMYSESSGQITYIGAGWSAPINDSSAIGSYYKQSNTVNNEAVFSFSGITEASWTPIRGPLMGQAMVYYSENNGTTWDGGTLIDLRKNPSTVYQQDIYRKTSTGVGTHKIRVVVDNRFNAAGYVTIDAFKVAESVSTSFTTARINALIKQPKTGTNVYGLTPIIGTAGGNDFSRYKLQYKLNDGSPTFIDFSGEITPARDSSLWPAQVDWSGVVNTETIAAKGTTINYRRASNVDAANDTSVRLAATVAGTNYNWPYRKAVKIINTGAAMTDYPIRIKVDFVGSSHMRTDFRDIRFTDSNGQDFLSQYRETYSDSGSAIYWVKIPSIDVGTPANQTEKTIYFYYGNANIGLKSDGESVFSVFDNFDTGTTINREKWTILPGVTSVFQSNGTLNFDADSNQDNSWSTTTRNATLVTPNAAALPTGDWQAHATMTPNAAVNDLSQQGIAVYGNLAKSYLFGRYRNGGNNTYRVQRVDGTNWADFAIPSPTQYLLATKTTTVTPAQTTFGFSTSGNVNVDSPWSATGGPYNDVPAASTFGLFAMEWQGSTGTPNPGYAAPKFDNCFVNKYSAAITANSPQGEVLNNPISTKYQATGFLESSIFDGTTEAGSWGTVTWTENNGAGTYITIQVRTSNDAVPLAPPNNGSATNGWTTWSKPIKIASGEQLPDVNQKHLQYRVNLFANAALDRTPILQDITFSRNYLGQLNTVPLTDSTPGVLSTYYIIRLMVTDTPGDWTIGDHAIASDVLVQVNNTSKPTTKINPLPLAASAPVTTAFDYTGTDQTFTVPDGVTSINVKEWGGGGGGSNIGGWSNAFAGGGGGYTTGTITVVPGQVLTIMVGGGGLNGTLPAQANVFSYGGGGPGCVGWEAGTRYGAQGGGRSAIRVGGQDILTAGGGGGAGTATEASPIHNGGGGGGTTGQDGGGYTAAAGGKGGTQAAGGTGGAGSYGSPATSHPGGNGSKYTGGVASVNSFAGGGGGGWYGGGGGAYNEPGHSDMGGGGGGSGYIGGAGVTGGLMQSGVWSTQGNANDALNKGAGAGGVGVDSLQPGFNVDGAPGRVVITYNPPPPAEKTITKIFTANATFTPPVGTVRVSVLAVGGGGGGGMDMGGGGGGGGVIYNCDYPFTAGLGIPISIGAGGNGGPAGNNNPPYGHPYTLRATSGGNTVFGSLTAIGGGYGGSSYWGYTPDNGYAGSGGSGGGASGYSQGVGGDSGRYGTGTAGQGNRGGGPTGSYYYSGGGGGAGAAGTDGPAIPHGGAGIRYSSISPYYFGGGGGGAAYSVLPGGNGGIGGGGGGAIGATTGGAGINNGAPTSGGWAGSSPTWPNRPGGNAGINTGGGGGGGSHYNLNNKGGDGGSGIVIVKYTYIEPTNHIKGTYTVTGTGTDLFPGVDDVGVHFKQVSSGLYWTGSGPNFNGSDNWQTVTDSDSPPEFRTGQYRTWKYDWNTISNSIPNGDYIIESRGIDKAGATEVPTYSSIPVRVDNDVPAPVLTTPADGGFVSNGQIAVEGTVADSNLDNYKVEYRKNNLGPWTAIEANHSGTDIVAVSRSWLTDTNLDFNSGTQNGTATFGSGAAAKVGSNAPVLLQDDFTGSLIDTATRWTLANPSNKITQSNNLIVSGGQSTWGGSQYMVSQRTFDKSEIWRIETDFTPTGGASGPMFGFVDPNYVPYGQYDYRAFFAIYDSGNGLYVYENGQKYSLANYFTDGVTYRLRLEIKPDYSGVEYYISSDSGVTWNSFYHGTTAVPTFLKVGWTNHSKAFTMDNFVAYGFAPKTANHDSAVYDAGAATTWNSMSWVPTTPPDSTITTQYRTGTCANPPTDGLANDYWSAWSTASNSFALQNINVSGKRYIQYRLNFTNNGVDLPSVNSVTVNYTGGPGVSLLERWDTTPLPEGKYFMRLSATDKAGNTAVSPTSTVTVDKTAPHATLNALPNNGNISGTINVTGTADDGLWTYRQSIPLTNAVTSVNNYQVKLSVPYNAAHMKSDYSDLRFTDSTGTVLLNYWIESSANPATIWVNVPSIPAPAGTTIYMYYGNSFYSNADNLAPTSWSHTFGDQSAYTVSEFGGATTAVNVWNFNNNWTDAKGVSTLTPDGGADFTTGSKLGSHAAVFNGAYSAAAKNPVTAFPTTALTSEFWVKTADTGDGILSYAVAASDNEFLIINSGNLSIYRGTSGSVATGVSINDNAWHHIAVTWLSAGGVTKLYKDGTLVYSGTLAAGTTIGAGGSLVFGQEQDSVGGGFDINQAFGGILDEARIVNTALTQEEIMKDAGVRNYVASNPPVVGSFGSETDVSLTTPLGANFANYNLVYSPDGSTWSNIGTNPHLTAVTNGNLNTWDTTAIDGITGKPNVPDNTYTLKLTVADKANNTTVATKANVRVDNTAPYVSSFSPAKGVSDVDNTVVPVYWFPEKLQAATINTNPTLAGSNFRLQDLTTPANIPCEARYIEDVTSYSATLRQLGPTWLTLGDQHQVTATTGILDISGNTLHNMYPEDDLTRVSYTGTWAAPVNDGSAINSYYRQSNNVGATAVFTFTGQTDVRWVAVRGATMGKARVYFSETGSDLGYDAGTLVDINTATSVYGQDVFRKLAAAPGTHKLKIEVVSGFVSVDAFKVGEDTTSTFTVTGVEGLITSPTRYARLSGNVAINGLANGSANWTNYRLDYVAHGSEGGAWTQIPYPGTNPTGIIRVNPIGLLGNWNTTGLNGIYAVRLTVTPISGTPKYSYMLYTVDNTGPTTTPSTTNVITKFKDTFDTPDTAAWRYGTSSSNQLTPYVLDKNNVGLLIGTGSDWSGLYRRQYTLVDKDAVTFDFRVDSATVGEAHAFIEATAPNGTYCRLCVKTVSGGNIEVQQIDETGSRNPQVLFAAANNNNNKWFRGTIKLNDDVAGAFEVSLKDLTTGTTATYTTNVLPKGLTWGFAFANYTGNLYYDNYSEWRQTNYTYGFQYLTGSARDLVTGLDRVEAKISNAGGDETNWVTVADRKFETAIDNCNGLATWAAAPSNSVTQNTTTKLEGTGALNLVKAAASDDAYYYRTIGAIDLRNKILNVWLYIKPGSLAKISQAEFFLYNDSWSSYTHQATPVSELTTGWNLLSINPNARLEQLDGTGTMDAITNIRLDVDTAGGATYAAGEVIMDKWFTTPVVLDSCDEITTWNNAGNIVPATSNSVTKNTASPANQVEGSASLNLIKGNNTTTTTTFQKTIPAVNLSNSDANAWVYIADTTALNKINKVSLNITTSGGAWTAYRDFPVIGLHTGWNLLSFTPKTSISGGYVTGTPDLTAVTRLRLDVVTNLAGDLLPLGSVQMDYWFLSPSDLGPFTMGDWHLDEGGSSTTTADSSGNNNNGTMVGSNCWTASGKFGANAFSGTGSNYITALNSTSTNISDRELSIEAWVYPTANTGESIIVNKENSFEIALRGGVFMAAVETDAGVAWNWGGTKSVALNTWSHLVFVHNNTSWQFYINGQMVESIPPANAQIGKITPAPASLLMIGARGGPASYFVGTIDEVKLYNRALTQADVSARYSEGYLATNTPAYAYTGPWSSGRLSGARNDSVKYSSTAGATITYTFRGNSITWVSSRGPDRGIARVKIDGTYITDGDTAIGAETTNKSGIDLYSRTVAPQALAYTVLGLSSGVDHTINIEVKGGSAASSGTRVDIDDFDVGGDMPWFFPWNLDSLVDGSHTLNARGYDRAGNMVTLDTAAFITDNAAPVAAITNPPASPILTTNANALTVNGTASDANFNYFALYTGYGSSPTSWLQAGIIRRTAVSGVGSDNVLDGMALPPSYPILRWDNNSWTLIAAGSEDATKWGYQQIDWSVANSPYIKYGIVKGKTSGTDAYISTPTTSLGLNAKAAKMLRFRMRTDDAAADGKVRLYWTYSYPYGSTSYLAEPNLSQTVYIGETDVRVAEDTWGRALNVTRAISSGLNTDSRRMIEWPIRNGNNFSQWTDYRLDMMTGRVWDITRYEDGTAGSGWTTLTNGSYSGGTLRTSATSGSTVTQTVKASTINLITNTGPDRGIMQVLVNGVKIKNGNRVLTGDPVTEPSGVDLYSATAKVQQSVFTITGMTNSSDIITVKVSGEKNIYSTATTIDIDAFECNTLISDTLAPGAPAWPNVGFWAGTIDRLRIDPSNHTNVNFEIAYLDKEPGDGNYGVKLNVMDLVGRSSTVQRSVTVDRTPPVVIIGSPNNLTFLPSTTVTITGTAYDPTVNGVSSGLDTVRIRLIKNVNSFAPVSIDAGLATGTTTWTKTVTLQDGWYGIEATVTDKAGNVKTSNLNYVTVDLTRPPAPVVCGVADTRKALDGGTHSAMVYWPPVKDVGSGIDYYIVKRGGSYIKADALYADGKKIEDVETSDSTITIAGENGGLPFTFRKFHACNMIDPKGMTSGQSKTTTYTVWAVDYVGLVSDPATFSVIYDNAMPNAPTGLTVTTAGSTNNALLAWTKSSSSDVGEYHIYRGDTASFVPDTDKSTNQVGVAVVAETGSNAKTATKFIDKDLEWGHTYYYQVMAWDRSGNPAVSPSNKASVTMAAKRSEWGGDINQDDTSVVFGSGWLDYAGPEPTFSTLKYSTTPGSTVTYTFSGTSIVLLSATGTDRGSAHITLRDESNTIIEQTDVNLYSADTRYKARVYSKLAMAEATGTKTITVAVNSGRVDVDGFEIDTDLPHVTYTSDATQCGLCHRAHSSESDHLVRLSSEAQLCYTCHDGTASNTPTKAEFDFASSGGHRVKDSNWPAEKMSCIDCHNPHLNNQKAFFDNFDTQIDISNSKTPTNWSYSSPIGTWGITIDKYPATPYYVGQTTDGTPVDARHNELKQTNTSGTYYIKRDTYVDVAGKGATFSAQVKFSSDAGNQKAFMTVGSTEAALPNGIRVSIDKAANKMELWDAGSGYASVDLGNIAPLPLNSTDNYRLSLKVTPDKTISASLSRVEKTDLSSGHDKISDRHLAGLNLGTITSYGSWMAVGTINAAADFDNIRVNNPGMLENLYREYATGTADPALYSVPSDRITTEAMCLSCHGNLADKPGGSQVQYYTSAHNPEIGTMNGQALNQDSVDYVKKDPNVLTTRWLEIRTTWEDLRTNRAYILTDGRSIGDLVKNTSNGCMYCHGYHGQQFYDRTQAGEEQLCYTCHGKVANKSRDGWNIYQQYNGEIRETSPNVVYSGLWATLAQDDPTHLYNLLGAQYSDGKAKSVPMPAPETFSPAWSDYSYGKRQAVVVNSGTALTDYPVKVTVPYDAAMKPEFTDLKFTDTNGSSVLPHWVESYTSTSPRTAVVWVRVPNLINGNSTIYMYYGKPVGTDLSNIAATFQYGDDFLGSTLDAGWSTTGLITVANSWVKLDEQWASLPTAQIVRSFPPQSSNFVLEAKFRLDGVWRLRPNLFRTNGTDPTSAFDYGIFQTSLSNYTDSDMYWNGAYKNISPKFGINKDYIMQYYLYGAATGQYRWRVGDYPNTLWYDDTCLVSGGLTAAQLPDYTQIKFRGQADSQQRNDSDWRFDWVRVRKINTAGGGTITEPTATITVNAANRKEYTQALLTFTGASVKFSSVKGPGQGTADIYIDGVLQGTSPSVNLAASAYLYNTDVFSAANLTAGKHTMQILPKSGTVVVDTFVVSNNGSKHGLNMADASIKCTSCHGQRAMTDRHVYELWLDDAKTIPNKTSMITNPANVKQYWSDLRDAKLTINDYCNVCHRDSDIYGRIQGLGEQHNNVIIPHTIKYPPMITTPSANGFNRMQYVSGDLFVHQEGASTVTTTGTWAIDSSVDNQYDGGAAAYSTTPGSTATFNVDGSANQAGTMTLVSRKNKDRGIIQIIVDGAPISNGNVGLDLADVPVGSRLAGWTGDPKDTDGNYTSKSGYDLWVDSGTDDTDTVWRFALPDRVKLVYTLPHSYKIILTTKVNDGFVGNSATPRVDLDAFKFYMPVVGHFLYQASAPSTTIGTVTGARTFTVVSAAAAQLAVNDVIQIDPSGLPHGLQTVKVTGVSGDNITVEYDLVGGHTTNCVVANPAKANCAGTCHDNLPSYVKESQEARTKITCVTCHHPHATENPRLVRQGEDYKDPLGGVFKGQCLHCHDGSVTK